MSPRLDQTLDCTKAIATENVHTRAVRPAELDLYIYAELVQRPLTYIRETHTYLRRALRFFCRARSVLQRLKYFKQRIATPT